MKHPTIIEKVREAIRLKHYSYRTEQSYVYWTRRFLRFHNLRHPREMRENEIQEFLSHLAVKENVAASTQNQALAALLFLYQHVLKIELKFIQNIAPAKKPEKIPTVFTREEVKGILGNLQGRYWLIASLLYGSGLRLTECLRLRVKDIDFHSNQIIIHDGKGKKDRVTMLPEKLKMSLIAHLTEVKKLHEHFLEKGYGTVELPYALAKKYPNADKEWAWQYVFPADNLSKDPRSQQFDDIISMNLPYKKQ
jgi:integron integrase